MLFRRARPCPRARCAAVRTITAAALVSVIAACGSDATTVTTAVPLPQRVVVTSIAGSKESALLAALYAKALDNAGLRVVRKDPVADRATAIAALERDEIQVVPELSGDLLGYLRQHPELTPPSTVAASTTTDASTTTATATTDTTGTGSTTTATTDTTGTGSTDPTGSTGPNDTLGDPGAETTTTSVLPTGPLRTVDDQIAVIRSLLPTTLAMGAASPAEDKQIIACAKKPVDDNVLGTYTDLGIAADKLVLAGPTGFETSTPLGIGTLHDAYKATFKSFVALDGDDKIAEAVKAGTVDCAVLSSTSPVIVGQTMTILLDDKALVSPNGVVPLLSTTGATPEVTAALDAVGPRLTTQTLAAMVSEMATKGTSPDVIASQFITKPA